MKAPKKDPIATAMQGKPAHMDEQTLAQMASEVWASNQNTLIAHWINEHPGVPSDEITLTMMTDVEGVHFSVKHTPKEAAND